MWKADAQHRSPIPVPNDSNQQNNNSEKQHNQPLVFGLIFFLVWLCFVVGVQSTRNRSEMESRLPLGLASFMM